MDTVTVSPKYQVVIPASVRKDLDIRPGEKVMVLEKDGVIHIIRVGDIKELRGKYKKLTTGGTRDETERFA